MLDLFMLSLRKGSVLLKKMPGAIFFIEPLRRGFARSERQFLVDDFDGDLKIYLRLNEHMQSQIFWFGYYSRDIVLLFNRLLRQGMIVVDVGANIGEVTLAAAKRVGKAGRVYAFEPMPALFEILSNNVDINGLSQVVPSRMALSDQAGVAPIYAADGEFSDGTRHDGLGTLYPTEVRARNVGEVDLQRLDDFRKRTGKIGLIKIDVEGAELAVLRGGRETIKNDQPYLVIEMQPDTSTTAGYKPDDIVRFLADLGYALFVIGRKAKLRPYQASDCQQFHNVLCVPPGKPVP